MTTRYAYLHGLSSSPLATKATHLRARFEAAGEALVCPDLNVPDFAHLTFDGALSALDAMAAAAPDARWRLIGSSMGGYLAARWAELHPRRVERLLLLCPGFEFATRWPALLGERGLERWEREGSFTIPDGAGVPTPVHWEFVACARRHPPTPEVRCQTRIIHGVHDEIVDVEVSRSYAAGRDHVELLEVDADHRLLDAMETVETAALDWLRSSTYHWDFYGPDRAATAEHFHRHLRDFLEQRELAGLTSAVERPAPECVSVTCAAPLHLEPLLRAALRPQRKT